MTFFEPIILSIKLSLVTTVFLFIFSVPFAWWLAQTKFKLKSVFEAVVALPLVLPPTVLGFYLLMALSPQSFLGRYLSHHLDLQLAFSFAGLIIASFFYSLPFAVQPIQSSFESIDTRLIEASFTMGHSRLSTFFKIILPLSKRGLVTAGVLSFAHTMGEFGVVLMVGGNIPGVTRVASIAIYDEVQNMNYDGANFMAGVLLAFSFTVLLLTYIFNRRMVRTA